MLSFRDWVRLQHSGSYFKALKTTSATQSGPSHVTAYEAFSDFLILSRFCRHIAAPQPASVSPGDANGRPVAGCLLGEAEQRLADGLLGRGGAAAESSARLAAAAAAGREGSGVGVGVGWGGGILS